MAESLPSSSIYFSYLIFFSPYLFKLISFIFLSPLFFTTSLLILLSLIASTIPPSKLGFIQSLIHKLRSNLHDHHDDDEFIHHNFQDFEIYKIVFHDPPLLLTADAPVDKHVYMDNNSVTVIESDEQRRLERLFEELDRFEGSTMADEMKQIVEFRKLEPVTSLNFVEDQKTDANSFSMSSESCRSESSRSFGSCGSVGDETTTFQNETTSHVQLVIGKLHGEHHKPVKTNSSSETTSYVRKVLQKLESVDISVSSEDHKPTVKSNSTAEIEKKKKNDETTSSHVKNVVKKLEPVGISVSGVKSDSTVAIETKKNIDTTSFDRKILQKVKTDSSTAEIEMKNIETTTSLNRKILQKVKSDSSTAEIETKNSETTSSFYGRKVSEKLISGEDEKSVQCSFTQSNSWRSDSSSSYGSMRKEKEWKRTLACKLFEERNSSGGEEGMDSLWEAYEDDNNKNVRDKKKSMSHRNNNNNNNNNKNKNKNKSELFKHFEDGENEEEYDDEDEFMSNGQLCCLKALKLSTGKMNLGMGKPNLVKISKVFKGFGWLHHVGSKNGKKN